MKDSSRRLIYKDGLCFEVTPDGLLYSPEGPPGKKKHPCPDCHFCQWCADSRCDACLQSCSRKGEKKAENSQSD